MSADLAAFLKDRLDEDEAAAKHADRIGYPDAGLTLAQSAHIARHDPARVLREVEAKRAIAEEHMIGLNPCDAHDGVTLESEPCDTLLRLAAVYSDHPDYREEWKP